VALPGITDAPGASTHPFVFFECDIKPDTSFLAK
jgi:hypothetical protein